MGTTAGFMLFTMGPAVMVACRRRLNGSGDGSHDSTNGLRETYFLRNTTDVNNRHRRLIEDVEIECMQAIDFFQKNYLATMEPSDIGDLAVDLWLKTHPESELANGWENYENVKIHKLVTECAQRAWVFSTGGTCEAAYQAERERLAAQEKAGEEEAADIQLQRQRRWRSFDWLEFQKHEAALASHGKRMPIYDVSDESQHPSEADIRGYMPLLQPCGAEPACRFGQEYIANGKIYGKKALPKGDPDTTEDYCATCECTGAVSRPPWSAGTPPADSPTESTGSDSTMEGDLLPPKNK